MTSEMVCMCKYVHIYAKFGTVLRNVVTEIKNWLIKNETPPRDFLPNK